MIITNNIPIIDVGFYFSKCMSFTTAGNTGGEYKHTLSVSEMPSHNHKMYTYNSNYQAGGGTDAKAPVIYNTNVNNVGSTNSATLATGSGSSHNNVQPYIVVYFWRRTA